MKKLRQIIAVVAILTVTSYAQGNSWNKVRYNGGTLATKVDFKDWNNQLTVTPDTITLKLKDGQVLEIPTKSVTGLSYGQEAHRRVGTMVALAILIAPVALFGLFHKTRLHYIGIEYATPDKKSAGVLLQGDKNNYRAILMALRGATGAKVDVAEDDRKYVPTGVEANVVSDKNEPQPKAPPVEENGSVNVTATSDVAEVFVDGAFVGNTPATLKLSAGKHSVKVSAAGFADWTRDLTVPAGSEIRLNAVLEKKPPEPSAGANEQPTAPEKAAEAERPPQPPL